MASPIERMGVGLALNNRHIEQASVTNLAPRDHLCRLQAARHDRTSRPRTQDIVQWRPTLHIPIGVRRQCQEPLGTCRIGRHSCVLPSEQLQRQDLRCCRLPMRCWRRCQSKCHRCRCWLRGWQHGNERQPAHARLFTDSFQQRLHADPRQLSMKCSEQLLQNLVLQADLQADLQACVRSCCGSGNHT